MRHGDHTWEVHRVSGLSEPVPPMDRAGGILLASRTGGGVVFHDGSPHGVQTLLIRPFDQRFWILVAVFPSTVAVSARQVMLGFKSTYVGILGLSDFWTMRLVHGPIDRLKGASH